MTNAEKYQEWVKKAESENEKMSCLLHFRHEPHLEYDRDPIYTISMYTDYHQPHMNWWKRLKMKMNIKKLSKKYPLAMKLHGSTHIGRLTLWKRIKMWLRGENK